MPRSEEAGAAPAVATAASTREQKGQEEQDECKLHICRLVGAGAPRLFVMEHIDGAGHRMMNIFNGIAFATGHRMNFGGIVGVPNTVTEQGSDFRAIVDTFFGDGASVQLFFKSSTRIKTRNEPYKALKHHPPFAHEFKTLNNFTMWRPRFENRSNIFLPSATGVPVEHFFTDGVRSELLRLLKRLPDTFPPDRPVVAIHIRRGDLKRTDTRATPDEFYYGLTDEIKAVLPQAEFHVFSGIENIMAYKEKPLWSSADFDGYRERGMKVHLDDPDLLVPWRHLSRAHVLVMSQSAFSYVPAVLSPFCVVHPGHKKDVPAKWINGAAVGAIRSKFAERLRGCLAALRDEGVAALAA